MNRSTNQSRQIACFRVGDLLVGIDIREIREINRHTNVTGVPDSPPAVQGVLNLRGEVVTVIDARTALGLPAVPVQSSTRLVVVHWQGELIGLLVDHVADVVGIESKDLLPPPANLSGVSGQYFHAVYRMPDDLLVLLELNVTLGQGEDEAMATNETYEQALS